MWVTFIKGWMQAKKHTFSPNAIKFKLNPHLSSMTLVKAFPFQFVKGWVWNQKCWFLLPSPPLVNDPSYGFSISICKRLGLRSKVLVFSEAKKIILPSPPLVNDPRHWRPHPSLLRPLQPCLASPWPSIMERHRWQCRAPRVKSPSDQSKVHLKECSALQLTEDSCFSTDGVGARASTGPPALTTCKASLGRFFHIAHTQYWVPARGKSGH